MSIDTLADAIVALDVDLHMTPEAYAVYADNMGYTLEDFDEWRAEAEELYAGEYASGVKFALNLAIDLGIKISTSWPYYCIDWEHAARELMYDYFEDRGHYFRNM